MKGTSVWAMIAYVVIGLSLLLSLVAVLVLTWD